MSEWTSVIAVYWALWALDGLRLSRRRVFALVGRSAGDAHVRYDRWILPPLRSTRWRLTTADVPFALSPLGISNQPIGSVGRPAESPTRIEAWPWHEVQAVDAASGWLRVNGRRFCPDTGHVTSAELLRLAKLGDAEREARIRAIVRGWFQPAHLRRRARVLVGRTAAVAACNTAAVGITAALSLYVVADIATRMGEERAAVVAGFLPYVVAALFVLHACAIVLAWQARRQLRRGARGFRAPGLVSAMVMPPQALRLRALLGEHFFPPTHPFAAILALGDRRSCEEGAFNMLADLRWPIPRPADSAMAASIAQWMTALLETELARMAASAGISIETLLAPPAPDSPASRSYCPRCRAQFIAGTSQCPNGIPLRAFTPDGTAPTVAAPLQELAPLGCAHPVKPCPDGHVAQADPPT